MPKQPPQIRWRDSDLQELQRVINNFNAKIYYQRKAHPELVDYLPKTLKKSEVVQSIQTRGDFNRKMASFQRFSKKGAEKPLKSERGAKMTEWALSEYKLGKRIEKAKLTRERNRLGEKDLLSRGEKAGGKRKEQGDVWRERLTPTNPNPMKASQKEWDIMSRRIDQKLMEFYDNQRMENYKINYMIALEKNGYPDELIDYVANIPNDIFYETTVIDQEGTIDFVYNEEEYNIMVESLWKVWRKAAEKAYIRDSAFTK